MNVTAERDGEAGCIAWVDFVSARHLERDFSTMLEMTMWGVMNVPACGTERRECPTNVILSVAGAVARSSDSVVERSGWGMSNRNCKTSVAVALTRFFDFTTFRSE
jgi:hypothetical protein